jgi:hypothetical protein
MGTEATRIERQARCAGFHNIGDDASRKALGTDALSHKRKSRSA